MKLFKVGCCVRDDILGIPSNDIDYEVIDSSEEEMIQNGFIKVGNDFPVFLHPITKEEYALARKEFSIGDGYTDFTFEIKDVTLKESLSRRDLTINSLAQDMNTGEIIDYFNGMDDLKNGILRHTSEAFIEDPVRILRIARFAARYNFVIAPETVVLIKGMIEKGMLNSLVPDRVFKELEKVLKLNHPEIFFQVLDDLGALEILFPELSALKGQTQPEQWHPEGDAFIHTMLVLQEAVQHTDDIIIRFASLVHDLGKGVTPKDVLPKHIGHELAGVPIVEHFCDRLRIPTDWKVVAMMTSSEHLLIHKFNELNSKTVLKMFERCDVFRKPENFRKMITASICDANGRGNTIKKVDFVKVERIMDLVAQTKATDIKHLIAKGLTGERMRTDVRRERLNTIKKVRVEV